MILEKMHTALKPLGFRKEGDTFRCERNDVLWVVHFQRSQKTTRDLLVATVNLGIFSHPLAARLGRDSNKPSVWDCHWQERLGFLLPERCDKWWEVSSGEQAVSLGEGIADTLIRHGMPTFAELSSTVKLHSLWASGQSPGLTHTQRQRYLDLTSGKSGGVPENRGRL